MVDINVLDLFVIVGFLVSVKINGKFMLVMESVILEEVLLVLVYEVMIEK